MLLITLLPLLLSAPQDRPAPAPLLPVRPRDPFVFRCVLDQNPRRIVAALDDEMWVAWDAETCGLVRAWKGGVHFDGPVYTTVHGPQPTTVGSVYTSGYPGVPWTAYEAGAPIHVDVRYSGYRIVAARVFVDWRLELPGERVVRVVENAEFVRPTNFLTREQCEEGGLEAGDQPGLQRRFEAIGLPDGVQVNVTVRTDGAIAKLAGALERESFEDQKDEKGNVVETRIWSQVPLSTAAPANSVVLFFPPVAPPATAPNDATRPGGK